ncbi:MAG: division/cell wall cluster transcriptional repressor MraZ [Bacteroidia bacterium]|nr:division/cell wall cluster transcriptional repressor MraZ [Bacteroidia bacterium]
MTALTGEYDCKVDAKGRLMFPVALKKKFGQTFEKGFVINRNLHQKSLVLYSIDEWNKLNKKLNKLNRLIKDNDVFVRKVTGGATEVEADSTGRILLPKALMDYAVIDSDVKVLGSSNIVEIWSKKMYSNFLNQKIDMAALAEKVMGGIDFTDDND